MNLEFTYLTSKEKIDIMTSIPKKDIINDIGNKIIKKREFKDSESKDLFLDDINSLMYARSKGIPKKIKKNK